MKSIILSDFDWYLEKDDIANLEAKKLPQARSSNVQKGSTADCLMSFRGTLEELA